MNFNETPEFKKEWKKLGKKYRSLPNDLEGFRKIIVLFPLGNSRHFNVITKNEGCVIIKARLFCKYLKGTSLRIIYAYSEGNNSIEFIEVYFKGSSGLEDKIRIKEYLEEK